ncbi:MAG: SRPBCC domain-containing protein [Solirubrobacterales bacterium]
MDEFQLHLEAVLDAPPERVFQALAESDQLAQWWGPAGFSSPNVDFDPRAGASYRIKMQPPEGEAFHLRGEFRKVEPPRRLAFTFIWEEPDPDDQETLVTLTLEDLGGSTRLIVDQGLFATEGRLELHRNGWSESFERLRDALAAAD